MKKKSYLINEQQLQDLISMMLGRNFDMSSGSQLDSLKNLFSKSNGKTDNKMSLDDFMKNLESSGKTETQNKNLTKVNVDFADMVEKIIDNFEGGYYNPETTYNSAMGKSGETMYGIDRKWGPESKTGLGNEFWSLIDEDRQKKPKCYKLEYDPANAKGDCNNPTLAKKLKDLISQMMKPEFESLSKKFLSEESREIVNSHPGLLFNFVYCVWNGSGYFQDFSKVMNEKVKSGIKNPDELSKIMLDFRKNYSLRSSFANNLIKRGGRNMESVINSMT